HAGVDLASAASTTTLSEASTEKEKSVAAKASDVAIKYQKDNKTARGHILSHMTNIIFDLFVNNRSTKSIWETLIKKYGADDAGMKKYVAGNWLNFKIDDDKPIMEQVHVYKNLTAEVLAEGMHMCEVLQANVLIERLPEAWSDYRNLLKHKKRDLTLEELIGHMKIEEANRQKDKNLNFMLPSIKANLVEPSVNYNDRSKFTKKKSTWQKKTPPFKKPATQFKTNAGCFVCGK
ncbi:hypothetical protein LINPERPRIM_LOCUS21963, partial [Linum perenne]